MLKEPDEFVCAIAGNDCRDDEDDPKGEAFGVRVDDVAGGHIASADEEEGENDVEEEVEADHEARSIF